MEIVGKYVGESEKDSAIKYFDNFRDLFLGYYIDNKLIFAFEDAVMKRGIKKLVWELHLTQLMWLDFMKSVGIGS